MLHRIYLTGCTRDVLFAGKERGQLHVGSFGSNFFHSISRFGVCVCFWYVLFGCFGRDFDSSFWGSLRAGFRAFFAGVSVHTSVIRYGFLFVAHAGQILELSLRVLRFKLRPFGFKVFCVCVCACVVVCSFRLLWQVL